MLTTAGAAIGLGNIWRFPYMMGKSGGSAFLLVYLVFVVAFGIPGFMAECALGRATRRGPVGALRAASLPGAGFWSGAIIVTIVMAASYYGVVLADVLGWAVSFSVATVNPGWSRGFDGIGSRAILFVVMLAMTATALGFGLRRGIETLSTFGLPLFFLLFIGLIVWVLN